MRMRRILAGCGLALATALAAAQAQAPADQGLGWMAGQWCAANGAIDIEETWLPERGGQLHGVSRMIKDGAVASFEFMRIQADDGTPTYFAQPGGREATAFRRTGGGPGWVRFENPAHDFPRRVEYRRKGDGLHAEIAGPGRDGRTMTVPFEFRRCGQ